MEVLARAEELQREGHEVVHFEVGEPDFATAKPIVEAGRQALSDSRTKYTAATGILPLREQISSYYKNLGIEVPPKRIVITSGASGGLVLLANLLLNPGEELLITDPGYPCNEVFAAGVGALSRKMPVSADDGFQATLNTVQSHWSKNSKCVLLASPSNPTGTMLSASSLEAISGWVAEQGGFTILDEIYQGIVHEPSYRSGLEITDNLFILNSFSKYFGMTGWRLGWLVVPEQAVGAVTKLAQNLFICPSAPAQYAALAAFTAESMQVHEERREIFRERAQLLANGLRELGFKIPVFPQGAFYLYVDVSHTGLDSTEFCWRLLNEHHVAVTPGEDFGQHQSSQFVRFAYTTDETSIRLGLQRIAEALDKLKG